MPPAAKLRMEMTPSRAIKKVRRKKALPTINSLRLTLLTKIVLSVPFCASSEIAVLARMMIRKMIILYVEEIRLREKLNPFSYPFMRAKKLKGPEKEDE
jgi:hypothetical protein